MRSFKISLVDDVVSFSTEVQPNEESYSEKTQTFTLSITMVSPFSNEILLTNKILECVLSMKRRLIEIERQNGIESLDDLSFQKIISG